VSEDVVRCRGLLNEPNTPSARAHTNR
jgi:hypothetical protein